MAELYRKRLLIPAEEVQRRVSELAEQISTDYEGKVPVLVGVLNGAFMFMADLVRRLKIDCEIDFVKLSSYGRRKESSGKVRLLKDLGLDIRDRDVLVVEDIVDSGLSVQWLRRYLESRGPRSLRFVTFLRKEGAARVDYDVEYVGFDIPNLFVVGYGLDFAEKFRNFPEIFVLEEGTEGTKPHPAKKPEISGKTDPV
ncbi:MAG: hypoxanthine phosphoribosyltransferase [candidate division KSB1 bacterium]|nr:hypoxanthine phosphoribosyltransferase [candidate division KSB1 bacterium]